MTKKLTQYKDVTREGNRTAQQTPNIIEPLRLEKSLKIVKPNHDLTPPP